MSNFSLNNQATLTKPHFMHYLAAWLVHGFTASAAFIGLLTLIYLYQHQYIAALWLMALTIFIDAVDGTLARLVKVKQVLPQIDGTLLDNIVDYLNYVITPCFFLFVHPSLVAPYLLYPIIFTIVITSSYQFCQADAKTPDHFFKGFPCYWNIAVFYMFMLNTSVHTNAAILIALCILIFIPIKYVYPSRLDYLTESYTLKILMHIFSIIYGISSGVLLWTYPHLNQACMLISLSYVVLYLSLSGYRTYSPLLLSKLATLKER